MGLNMSLQNEAGQCIEKVITMKIHYLYSIIIRGVKNDYQRFFPRLKGETMGFRNFVKEDGILMDYHETVEIYKQKMKELISGENDRKY